MAQTLRLVWDRIHALEGRDVEAAVLRANLDGADFKLTSIADPSADQDAVNLRYLNTNHSPERMQFQLQAPGEHPLDVTNLKGQLADPQKMRIEVLGDHEELPDPLLAQAYEIVYRAGILYYFDTSSNPGQWIILSTAAAILAITHQERLDDYPPADQPYNLLAYEIDRGQTYRIVEDPLTANRKIWLLLEGYGTPMTGTINPDEKPDDLDDGTDIVLNTDDTGFRFHSTDFEREFRWSGLIWEDAPGEPARQQIVFYQATPDRAGWAPCNGATTSLSTSGGDVVAFTPPDLMSPQYFLRSNSSAGGTGGSYTHTHGDGSLGADSGGAASTGDASPGTGGPSATTNVTPDGTAVASSGHTHSVNAHSHSTPNHTHGVSGTTGAADTQPQFYDAMPWIRL
jgi:hypothetical protein